MKRLALLLGSLLVVSAAASAKEVVPAPVVVEEAPVQVVEKEVIVYRDKEEGFRPNGFVGVEYRYYDRTEGQQKVGGENWNGNNRYSRLQLQANVNFTENQTLDIRTRDYNSLANKDRMSGPDDKSDQVRVQYYYNHGLLGDTKVNGTSFVEYLDEWGNQSIQYRYDFQLADYMFDNDFIKTTNFVVGPRAIYKWANSNSSDYSYTLGLYMDWINQLPFGFSTEVEIDGFDYTKYGKGARVANTTEKNAYGRTYVDKYGVSVKAVLMQDTPLYSQDKVSVNWHSEGGYDTYNYSNRELVKHDFLGFDKEDKAMYGESEYAKYEAYFSSDVTLNYQATEFVNLFAGAGAEYRNWTISAEEDASNWRWQPYAFAGFNVSF